MKKLIFYLKTYFHLLPQLIYHKLFLKYSKYKLDAGKYLKQSFEIKGKNILIYMNNNDFFHAGDQLFFEPVARFLEEHGYCVNLAPTENMRSYFMHLGYKLDTDNNFTCYDLVITRTYLAMQMRKVKSNILFVHSASHIMNLKLCDYMISQVAQILQINYINYNARISGFLFKEQEQKSLADKYKLGESQYIIVNNYLKSYPVGTSKDIITKGRIKIFNYANKFATSNNFKVILTGTRDELEHDTLSYQFEVPVLDLRGQTSIDEAFYLASLKNVRYYLGYDTFWAHAFSSYLKPSYILVRPYGSHTKMIIDYVVLPFATTQQLITFID